MARNVVLVPVDFGRASLRAIQVAGSHASASGDALLLLHVREPGPRGFCSLSAELGATGGAELRHRVLQHLERLAGPWKATVLIRDGAALETILGTADEVGAQRIVIGRHGVRGVERMVLGSVAEGVLRGSESPVMVVGSNAVAEPVRGLSASLPGSVLCAVDFDHGGPVIEAAGDYAREAGTALELAHVYEVPVIDAGRDDLRVTGVLRDAVYRAAAEELERLARRYGAARWHLRRGHVGNELLALLDARQPTTLIVGARGRRRVRRAALGDVADWLLRRSTTPVLVNPYAHTAAVAAARLAS